MLSSVNLNREEEAKLLKWHPEILLISKTPPTFDGFLTLSENCHTNVETLLKIKLMVPLFPSLEDMTIHVTKNFEFSSFTVFVKIILELLDNETSLSSFLKRLKESLMLSTKDVFNQDVLKSNRMSIMYDSLINRLRELRDLLFDSQGMQIFSNHNLNIIKFIAGGVSVIVQNDEGNLWKIVYSEIPSISHDNSIECTRLSLNHVCNWFTTKMNDLEQIWVQLREIDTHCWVMDPVNPKPYHLYRRIYLTPSLSVMITINPSYLKGVPDFKFLGSESTISEYHEKVSNRVQIWDPDCTLLQNISLLLNINTFPEAPSRTNEEVAGGIVNDEDCCICFLEELEDGQHPNILCSNERCRKQYHLSCLQRWLETISGNPTIFDKIHGECPHCGENITCVL